MLPLFSQYETLDAVNTACRECLACPLGATRKKVVFGTGNSEAAIMLVGQGPSPTDDSTGLPYSGPAGDLLDTALGQADLSREEIWITNLHKCLALKPVPKSDPTNNRPQIRSPKVAELNACRHWLEEELLWVKPSVLVAIGGPAAQVLIGKGFQLTEQRGRWLDSLYGIPTLATYQPTYLKRLNQWDRTAAVQGWRDMVADLNLARARAYA